LALEAVLQSITVACLTVVLAVFLYRLARRAPDRRTEAMDFGTAFSTFVAGWMTLELLEFVAPVDWSGAIEILHFLLLALFAVWMNARWRWAVRRAREVL